MSMDFQLGELLQSHNSYKLLKVHNLNSNDANIIYLNISNNFILQRVLLNFNIQMIKESQKPINRTSMVFNKSYGQHILINSHILNEMVNKSGVRATDVVLQIGPGTGNLTQLLLEKAKKVIAVELDPRMVAQLTKRFKYTELGHKLTLIPGDFLTVQLPYFDICIANVPYQISSPLTFKLLSHKPMFRCAVLMFQKQFAQRLTAKPGSELYCRLSVNVQLLSRVDHLIKVSKNNFKPPPKVQSSIVRIEPKSPLPDIDFLEWDGLLRICFIRKNKTLQAMFKNKTVLDTLKKNAEKFQKLTKQEDDMIKLLGNIDVAKQQEIAQQEIPQSDQDQGSRNEMIQQNPQQKKKQQLNEFKEKIMEILKKTTLQQKRSSKLSLDDFLKLLYIFNENGIHFR